MLLHEGGSQTPPPGDIDACVGISGPIVEINAGLDPAIDAVITGHTHLPYNCTLTDPAGAPRIVTSAFSFGRVVSEINLVIDKGTTTSPRRQTTSVNHAVVRSTLTPDPAITAVIDKWKPLGEVIGDEEVGSITADIQRGGTLAAEDRTVESNLGNMIADAQLWATR